MKNKIIITILCTLMAVGTLTGCGAGKTDSRIVIWTNMSVEVDTLQKYAADIEHRLSVPSSAVSV